MGFDNAYEAIIEGVDDPRWAFGTGFVDPLAGIETSVPAGVDAGELATYCLMLADDALVMSHRLQEWLTRAPELEEETALANIALDLLGQARVLLSRAGAIDGSGRSEDDLAYLREAGEFRNVCFVEAQTGDFAELVLRAFVVSVWRLALFAKLRASRDPVLAAVAAKGVPELGYHRDYAADWVIRLGDGTDESRRRMCGALDIVAPTLAELFSPTEVESRLADAGVAVNPYELAGEFHAAATDVLDRATLPRPERAAFTPPTGRLGRHTSALDELLAELQGLARAHPGAVW
jgi:ring-1,2-phenylacetyl-CoA epoxidase subunit PaaC